jgi:sulfofructose kinase
MRFPFKISNSKAYDAIGFGTNAVDHLIRVPKFPEFGTKVELNEYSVTAGGEVASTLVGLSRLGARTAYAGRFGSDREGEIGLASLEQEGVNTEHADVVKGARTQVAFILVDESTGERTIVWHRDEKLAYASQDAPIQAAGRGRLIHVTAHDVGACIRMAMVARRASAVVSLDIDKVFDGVDDLLPLVDICITSAEFPEKLTGVADQKSALTAIHDRYGCAVTGLTLGSKGSIILCEGSFIETNGFPVPGGCVDTTGAGDAFRTGLLIGLLQDRDLDEAAEMANAVAALKCRCEGARSGLPDSDELSRFLSTSSR